MRASKRPRGKQSYWESIIFLVIIGVPFYFVGSRMGLSNFFNTIMHTAHQLLLNTVFFIMAIAVLTGALGTLLSEFGVLDLLNRFLSILMKPLYDLPGAAAMGALTCYLSDNPAILSLAHDKCFRRFFKRYQIPALTNLGTSFGMGLIVTTFMMGQGSGFARAALLGNLGAFVGSIVSVRLMLISTKQLFGTDAWATEVAATEADEQVNGSGAAAQRSAASRALDALLEGGQRGVDLGLAVIPGVLIICTIVLMLTNGPSPEGVYTGAAFEGIPILPWLGQKISFITKPLFGFQSAEAIAFPITALGAVGAALSLVPAFLAKGLIGGNEIAVFTAIGMCWSGYLSTHIAMMDALECRELTSRAIFAHTIGGIVAGMVAHFAFLWLG